MVTKKAYRIIRPHSRLGLQFRAVPHLQRATAPAGKKLSDLLPREVFVLLEVDEQLVVLGTELELRAARAGRRLRHPGLADGAREAAGCGFGRRHGPCPQMLSFGGRRLRREAVVVVVRRVRLQVCVVDGVPLALRVRLRREDLLRAVEAFLRFLGVEEEVNFVFGAGGAASLS